MKLFKIISVVCLAMIVAATASPVPQTNNDAVTADFLHSDQMPINENQSAKVKRRIYEENNDRHLKQISLSSLLGDLEEGLFASALSVHKVLTDKNVNVPEIKPNNDNLQHEVNKRQSVSKEETGNNDSNTTVAATTKSSVATAVNNKVILQTTEKVPEGNGKPAHIVIDRIAIQPHTGGVAFIPVFELKRSINDDNTTTKDREITKITISKTEITSLANLATAAAEVESSSSTTTDGSFLTMDLSTNSTPITSTASDNSSTTTTTTTSHPSSSSTSPETVVTEVSTTPKNIEQLKEAEEQLKEKVAEIEAEPIILSARV